MLEINHRLLRGDIYQIFKFIFIIIIAVVVVVVVIIYHYREL
jgi:hypothetical protein